MRDILFRGKAINRDRYESFRTDYKNGDWVYGLLTKKYDERFENLPAEMTNEDGISGIDIDYKTIGQYTGLTDKNGKKIYENDILNCEVVGIQYPAKVVFKNGSFGVAYTHRGIDYFNPFTSFVESVEFEIIGNIHDNPELLEGE